jgi:hypothetical protein
LFGITGVVGKNLVLLTASACDHESPTETVSKALSLRFCHLFRYKHLDFFLLHLFGHAKTMLVDSNFVSPRVLKMGGLLITQTAHSTGCSNQEL